MVFSADPAKGVPARRPVALAAGPSLMLDVVRFGAALVVAFGHITQPYFSAGTHDYTNWAFAAVGVFFALSGFVIRYITTTRVADARAYIVDRASRIYSVAIPALALTIVLDALSLHFNRSAYLAGWGFYSTQPMVRIVANLLFVSQAWFHGLSPFSNSPFWSLGYECAYYALYGAWFYLRGTKRMIGIAAIALLMGPGIFLLFPIWLLGVLAYDIYAEGRIRMVSMLRLAGMAILAMVAAPLGKLAVSALNAPVTLNRHNYPILGAAGVIAAIAILAGCFLAQSIPINERQGAVRAIRRIADATFALYLMHFPIFVFFDCAVPYNHRSVAARAGILVSAVLFSIAVAPWLDVLKKRMRKGFSKVVFAAPVAQYRQT